MYGLLVCGSRFLENDLVKLYIKRFIQNRNYDYVVSGGCKGVDTVCREVCFEIDMKFVEINADWKKYGKKAGFVRNMTMVKCVDDVLGIYNGNVRSEGTKHSCNLGKKMGKKVFEKFWV